MEVLTLSDYHVAPRGAGNGLKGVSFSLMSSDVCCLDADSPDDAHLLLMALATLAHPTSGEYRFIEKSVDFSDYRKLLAIKKRVGYVASDAAMISNRSLRENLLLMRNYFEDHLSLTLEDDVARRCERFGIDGKLDLRPEDLNLFDVHCAIFIRETEKPASVLLLDRPEDFVGAGRFPKLLADLKEMLSRKIPLVCHTNDTAFMRSFANRKIVLRNGVIADDFRASR